jgi:hypothetical protein
MPHTPRNPIQKLWIPRIRKHASILRSLPSCTISISTSLNPQLSLLLLLSPPFLFLPSLPLRPIIQQKRQGATKRQDNQTLKDIRIDIVSGIVVIVAFEVVVAFVVVPASEFGLEEGGEPVG